MRENSFVLTADYTTRLRQSRDGTFMDLGFLLEVLIFDVAFLVLALAFLQLIELLERFSYW